MFGPVPACGAAPMGAHFARSSSSTPFAEAVSVEHVCGHRCQVAHVFGNVYRCSTTGMVHVCDNTCNQQLYNDRYSTICRISKRVVPIQDVGMGDDVPRKRSAELHADPALLAPHGSQSFKRQASLR